VADIIRAGDYREVFANIRAELPDHGGPEEPGISVIGDPPYSPRVHAGARSVADVEDTDGLAYEPWTPADVAEFCGFWCGDNRATRWVVALCDHGLIEAYETGYERAGWYAFSPLACIVRGGTVRIAADGPSQWSVWAMVARPRTRVAQAWRALPGAYPGTRGGGSGGEGRSKPAWLCNALVRDYSNPGDMVIDPCAGTGAINRAALSARRRTLGAELNPFIAAEAAAALARPLQIQLLGD
jgi:site-specific DNA-methyltransferase (adenine-specific)